MIEGIQVGDESELSYKQRQKRMKDVSFYLLYSNHDVKPS